MASKSQLSRTFTRPVGAEQESFSDFMQAIKAKAAARQRLEDLRLKSAQADDKLALDPVKFDLLANKMQDNVAVVDKLVKSENAIGELAYAGHGTRATTATEIELNIGKENARLKLLVVRGLNQIVAGDFCTPSNAFEDCQKLDKAIDVKLASRLMKMPAYHKTVDAHEKQRRHKTGQQELAHSAVGSRRLNTSN